MQHLWGDFPDGFAGSQNGDPDGMPVEQGSHQIVENHAVGRIQVHTDFLVDDTPLLFHTFLGEIRGGYKFQQQFQTAFKIFRGGKIVGGHIVAGEGVGHGAHFRKFGADIPVPRQVKHLMFQIVGHTGRRPMVLAVQHKICMDGAVIGDEIGQFLGKTLPGYHQYRQTVFQAAGIEGFVQFRIVGFLHWLPPFRK